MAAECSREDRKRIGEDIRYIQERYPRVGLPTWRPLGRGISEIRSVLTGDRISRILVLVEDGTIVLLHGFIKKTRTTPTDDLAIARRRMRDVKSAAAAPRKKTKTTRP